MHHSVTPHFALTVYLCGPFSSHTKQQSFPRTLILVMGMQYVFWEVGTTLVHVIYMIQKLSAVGTNVILKVRGCWLCQVLYFLLTQAAILSTDRKSVV